MDIFLFIIGAFVVVTVHEFGHYLLIRLCRFHVEEISIGIGPKLFSFSRKRAEKVTKYSLRLIPIAGFVSSEELSPDYESSTYGVRKLHLKRVLCYLAGPLSSLLLALALLLASGNIKGLHIDSVFNEQLMKEGITNSDILRSVNGKRVYSISDIDVLFHPNEENILQFANPEDERKYISYRNKSLDGIAFSRSTFCVKLEDTMDTLGEMFQVISELLREIVRGDTALVNDMSYNPYSYYEFEGTLPFSYKINYFIVITAVFSWSLFIFNLLPIVFLDGFKSIYSMISVLINRKLSKKELIIIHCLGALFTLWILF